MLWLGVGVILKRIYIYIHMYMHVFSVYDISVLKYERNDMMSGMCFKII